MRAKFSYVYFKKITIWVQSKLRHEIEESGPFTNILTLENAEDKMYIFAGECMTLHILLWRMHPADKGLGVRAV